jgi:hypothetical protein
MPTAARYDSAATGVYKLLATATDLDGYTGTTTENIRVRDPQDQSAPLVVLVWRSVVLASPALLRLRAASSTAT